MEGKIRMRAFSLLLAVMLVGAGIVPAVSAQSAEMVYENRMSNIVIEKVSENENSKEYYATVPLKDGAKKKYFVKEWKTEADGKDIWRINLFEIDTNGVVASEPAFGRDSYYWWDSDGVHIHFGPMDMDLLSGLSPVVLGHFGAFLALALGIAALPASVFGGVLASAIIVSYWFYRNTDGSMDVYLSNTTVALIPVYALLPGSQPIVVQLGSHDVVLLL